MKQANTFGGRHSHSRTWRCLYDVVVSEGCGVAKTSLERLTFEAPRMVLGSSRSGELLFFFFGKRALNAHIEVVGGSKHVCTTYVIYPTSRICLATIVGERRERSACLPDTPNQVQNKGTHVRACFRLVSSGGRHHVRVVAVVLVGSCRLVSATLAPLARERPPDAHSSRGEFRTKRCCRARTMPCYCTFSQH